MYFKTQSLGGSHTCHKIYAVKLMWEATNYCTYDSTVGKFSLFVCGVTGSNLQTMYNTSRLTNDPKSVMQTKHAFMGFYHSVRKIKKEWAPFKNKIVTE